MPDIQDLGASDISEVNGKYIFTSTEMVVEVGDTKQTSFYPQVKVMKWNNEINFSVRYTSDLTNATESKDNNDIITWIGKDNVEVKMYEKSDPNDSDAGGFEFEFTIPSKPSSNVFDMTIQTKGLSFIENPEIDDKQAQSLVDVYQRAYNDGHDVTIPTLEEAKRLIRPENVVGSYAAYHASQRDGEYKTGKAFHIYRPKATDKDGNSTWCELKIDVDNGILRITVPQEFLDEAVYPVLVDPTFGYTTVGGTWQSYVADQAGAGVYAANATTNIDKLTLYVKNVGGSCNNKGVMWTGGATPASVLTNGVTPAFQATSSTGKWEDAAYSSKPSVSNGTNYRLGIVGSSGWPYMQMAYDGTYEIHASNSYATPADYSPSSTEPTFQPSVYATYAATTTTIAPKWQHYRQQRI